MNNIETSICDAIEIIVDRAVEKASYDKTVQATIVSCIDQTIGKYSVRYQDSTFYAYSNNSDVTYTKGSTVYVLIPGNDTDADKTILGTTKKLGINYVTTIEDDEAYQIIGNNCIEDSSTSFNLQSYKKIEDNKPQIKVLYSNSDETEKIDLIGLNETSVNEYIKNQKYLVCGATVRTELPTEQCSGDYGIIFALKFNDNTNNSTVTRYYTINVDKMSGNPYKMLYDTRQYGIFEIDGDNFIDVNSISIFCRNFPNTKPDNECVDDIFIKNIELCGAERLSDEDLSNYSLTFYTPQGTYFDDTSSESDTRSIEAQVRVKGKIIDNESQPLSFYWFMEDTGITSESPYYNKYGGQGWKCLNDYTVIKTVTKWDDTGKEIIEPKVLLWKPSSYKWTVSKKDIIAKEIKYKCSVLYDGIVISKTIIIKNLVSKSDITIVSDKGTQFYFDSGRPTLKCLINGEEKNDSTYSYSWAIINNTGSFESVSGATGNTLSNLNVNTITNFNTYKCTVYQNKIYLGTGSIVLTNSLAAEGTYSIIIHDGSHVFKYDENGVSPASEAVDNPIEIKALTFSVYNNLGERIDDENIKHGDIQWIVPIENTMIKIPESDSNYEEDLEKGIRIYKGLSFAYKIRDIYDINKSNNNIQLMVNYKNVNLSAKTDLVFIKEGDAGTNGTEYFCRIVPNVADKQKAPMYPTLTELHDGWVLNYQTPQDQNNYFFKVQLWHNENKILDSVTSIKSEEGEEATIKWSILQNKYNTREFDDSSLSVNENTGYFSYHGISRVTPYANIVKVEVKYKKVVYYATIPLIVVYLSDMNKENYRVNLKEGTGFINAVYSSDGKRPRYNTNPFELIVTKNDEDISLNSQLEYSWNYLGQICENVYENGKWTGKWIEQINLEDKTIGESKLKNNQKAIKPLDDYDGQCVNNTIKCIIKEQGSEIALVYIPVHLMLNRYGNSAINGWDGNSVNINEEGGFILTPQVGAGIKEEDNSFTGVVMGKVKETNQSNADVGLIGYSKGVRSIFLDSNTGKAVFGANKKGQITIDPGQDTAKIYSGNFNYESKNGTGTGMEIDLTIPQIRFGNGNFEVSKEGHLTAKGKGSIAGWRITDTELYSPAPYSERKITLDSENAKIYSNKHDSVGSFYEGFYLGQDGISLRSSYINKKEEPSISSFVLKTDGEPEIYSNNKASLKTARDGFYLSGEGLSIGSKFYVDDTGVVRIGSGAVLNTGKHWEINGGDPANSNSNSYIKYGEKEGANSVYISTGMISLGKKFYVDNTGVMRVGNGAVAADESKKYWIIDGNNFDSYISYGGTSWSDANSDNSEEAKVYLGTDGISLGHRFSVSDQGHLKAYSGIIGGWNINKNKLTANNMEINSNGSLKGGSSYSWSIDTSGTATFNRLKADTGGTIGGWTINSWGLSSRNIEIRSDGDIYSSKGWSINNDGSATFSNINITGGQLILGGTTLNGNGTVLTADNTTVGNVSLERYIENLTVKKLQADDVIITNSLNVGAKGNDVGKNYYLQVNKNVQQHPALSGLILGWGGIITSTGERGLTTGLEEESKLEIVTGLIKNGSNFQYIVRELYFIDGILVRIDDPIIRTPSNS